MRRVLQSGLLACAFWLLAACGHEQSAQMEMAGSGFSAAPASGNRWPTSAPNAIAVSTCT